MKKLILALAIFSFVAGSSLLYSQEESALGGNAIAVGTAPISAQVSFSKIFDYYTMEYPSAFIQKKGKMSGSLTLRNYEISRVKTTSVLDSSPFSDKMTKKVTAYSILANFAVTSSIEVLGGFDFTNRNIPDPTGNTKFHRKISKGLWGINAVLKRWKNGSSIASGIRYSSTDPDTLYLSSTRFHIVASKPYFGGRMIGNFALIYNYLNSWLFQDKSNYFYNIELVGSFDFKLLQSMFVRAGFQEETTEFPAVPKTYMLELNYKPSTDYNFSFFYEKMDKSFINSNGASFVKKTLKNTLGMTLTFVY